MKRTRRFVREKKIHCGADYMEVDIIPRVESEDVKPGTRSKKEKVSAPKQRNLNDKNAKRYFVQILNSNFGKDDIHTTLTYAKEFLPETIEEAEKEAANYIRRVSYRRKKDGLPPLKYILVTEYSTGKGSEKPIRIHHHIIMNGGLDRDTIEDLWRRPKKKGQKKGEKIGFANADRLQPDDYGLEALARYLMKNPNGKKRWSSSQNLVKPWSRNNDSKYTKKQIEKIARDEPDNMVFWWKQYPGWLVTECKPEYNDVTGWAIYLKLRRLKE